MSFDYFDGGQMAVDNGRKWFSTTCGSTCGRRPGTKTSNESSPTTRPFRARSHRHRPTRSPRKPRQHTRGAHAQRPGVLCQAHRRARTGHPRMRRRLDRRLRRERPVRRSRGADLPTPPLACSDSAPPSAASRHASHVPKHASHALPKYIKAPFLASGARVSAGRDLAGQVTIPALSRAASAVDQGQAEVGQA